MARSRRLIGRAAHTAARTALIAGTATAVSGAIANRRTEPAPGQDAAPAANAAPEAATANTLDQLKTLGELRAQGVLTEEEFAAQKARILG